MSAEAAQADLAASLRSDLNNEFPSVDYSRDFNNPIMLKALLFAARARDKHSKLDNASLSRTKTKQPAAKKAKQQVVGAQNVKGAEPEVGEDMSEWIECIKCQKWRCWRTQAKLPDDDVEWHCALNSDSRFNSCAIDQEASDAQIDVYVEAGAATKAKAKKAATKN